jgi:hypothetical protein
VDLPALTPDRMSESTATPTNAVRRAEGDALFPVAYVSAGFVQQRKVKACWRIVSRPDDLVEALPHDNGVTVMARDPNLTVLGVVIPGGLPKKLSVPHNHLMWVVMGIYGGQEDNQFFRRDGDTLAQTGGRSLTPATPWRWETTPFTRFTIRSSTVR